MASSAGHGVKRGLGPEDAVGALRVQKWTRLTWRGSKGRVSGKGMARTAALCRQRQRAPGGWRLWPREPRKEAGRGGFGDRQALAPKVLRFPPQSSGPQSSSEKTLVATKWEGERPLRGNWLDGPLTQSGLLVCLLLCSTREPMGADSLFLKFLSFVHYASQAGKNFMCLVHFFFFN